jgi:hypothetical protein
MFNANILCALLVEKLILTDKEGRELASKLGKVMLPSDYDEAHKLIKKLLKDL